MTLTLANTLEIRTLKAMRTVILVTLAFGCAVDVQPLLPPAATGGSAGMGGQGGAPVVPTGCEAPGACPAGEWCTDRPSDDGDIDCVTPTPNGHVCERPQGACAIGLWCYELSEPGEGLQHGLFVCENDFPRRQ